MQDRIAEGLAPGPLLRLRGIVYRQRTPRWYREDIDISVGYVLRNYIMRFRVGCGGS